MTTKDRQKQINDKCQSLLAQMLRDDDNKYCVDCDAKGPRWASWNLGIFLCIRCAGIHRNLGVHISKVKSVNLDTWTPEQVVSLQSMGNSRARAVYEANLPDSFRRPQNDSALEAFIRAKYEQKKYIAREWVQPPLPKVNWDKELEEEEKARRKKRESKTTSIPAAPTPRKVDNVIPQPLPKPTSSPKSQRNTPPTARHKPPPPPPSQQQQSQQRQQQPSTDLLGLDTPVKESGPPGEDDMFSGFLTAVTTADDPVGSSVAAVAAATQKRTQEEENFFSQVAPPGINLARDKKLDTDSILALYAKTTPPQPQQVGGVGYPQTGTGAGQMYCQPYQMQNGIVAQPQPNPQGNMFVPGGVINPVNVASNPFYSMAVATATQSFQQHQQTRIAQQMSGLSLGSGVGAASPALNTSGQMIQQQQLYQQQQQQPINVFVGQPQQQQFYQPASQGHTLANNLWQ